MADKKGKIMYAPGMDDKNIIPDADSKDKRKGNVTRETRVFLDENDSSGRDHR